MVSLKALLVVAIFVNILAFKIHTVSAKIVLTTGDSDDALTTTKCYSPQLASRLDFSPVTGPALLVGDQCNFKLKAEDIPIGAILFYTRVECDEGGPLQGFVSLADRLGAVVELYGSKQAVVDLTQLDPDPNDLPPRYALDPRPAQQSLNVVRVHGGDAGRIARFLTAHGNDTSLTAMVEYTADPWKKLYLTPQWIFYEAIVICFFCIYIPQHALRSLIFTCRIRRKLPLHMKGRGLNLQTVMMSAALVLGVVRIVEYTAQTLRDYADIWSPEIISQLAWGYGYMILLLCMLLLVLYWADVMKTSRVKLTMIESVTTKFFVIFGIVAFTVLTAFIVLFVYEVPGTSYVRAAGFLLLGSVALIESVGTIIYGGRLLKQLTDVKPIADRGSLHRSPSIGHEGELTVSSENPQFDPAMNSGSNPSSDKKTVRSSYSKNKPKSNTQLNSDDSEEKRRVRAAQKRAKPLTRLVVISATLLFVATCLSAAASFSPVLNSPDTYIVIFLPLAVIEITIYALVIQVMSPIWQERRRRFARSESETQLMPLSEERAMSIEAAPRAEPCKKVTRCIRNWCVV